MESGLVYQQGHGVCREYGVALSHYYFLYLLLVFYGCIALDELLDGCCEFVAGGVAVCEYVLE